MVKILKIGQRWITLALPKFETESNLNCHNMYNEHAEKHLNDSHAYTSYMHKETIDQEVT